jgi:hypothetical protein
MRRKEVIVRPIPRNDRLGTAPQGGEFLLPSGLMAAGHDDRIIGSDVSSSFVSLAHMGYTQAAVLCDYVEALCQAAGTAMDRLLRAQYSVADVAAFLGSRRHGHHAMVPNRTRFSASRRHIRCRRQAAP